MVFCPCTITAHSSSQHMHEVDCAGHVVGSVICKAMSSLELCLAIPTSILVQYKAELVVHYFMIFFSGPVILDL